MMGEDELLGRFERVQRLRDDEWMALCPAHGDRNPSLHVTRRKVAGSSTATPAVRRTRCERQRGLPGRI